MDRLKRLPWWAWSGAAVVIAALVMIASSGRSYANWRYTEERDAFANVTLHKASRLFRGKNYDLGVTIGCTDGGSLTYEVTGYGKAGGGAAFRTSRNTIVWRGSASSYDKIILEARAGSATPFTTALPTTAENVAGLTTQIGSYNHMIGPLVQPESLVLRVEFERGTETYTVDQSDARFRRFIGPCLPKPTRVEAPTVVDTGYAPMPERNSAESGPPEVAGPDPQANPYSDQSPQEQPDRSDLMRRPPAVAPGPDEVPEEIETREQRDQDVRRADALAQAERERQAEARRREEQDRQRQEEEQRAFCARVTPEGRANAQYMREIGCR